MALVRPWLKVRMTDSFDDTLSDMMRTVRLSSAGWHIQRLSGQLERAMNAELAAHDLTLQGFAILNTVFEREDLSQAEIGARFSAPPYAITRALDGLEAAGFVTRREDPQSKRVKRVRSTGKARRLAPEFHRIVRDVNARLVSALDARDTAQLMALLRQVLTNNDL